VTTASLLPRGTSSLQQPVCYSQNKRIPRVLRRTVAAVTFNLAPKQVPNVANCIQAECSSHLDATRPSAFIRNAIQRQNSVCLSVLSLVHSTLLRAVHVS